MRNFIFLLLFLSLLSPLTIKVFYSQGCPHCAKLKSFLSGLDAKINFSEHNISVEYYEVHNQTNYELFMKTCEEHNIKPLGVPTTFIGNKSFVGDSKDIENEIKSIIEGHSGEEIENKSSFIPFFFVGLIILGIIILFIFR